MNYESKICACCKTEKSVTKFHKRGNKLHSYCKECRKLKLDKNKEKLRKRNWYLENRDLTIGRAAKRAVEKPEDITKYKTK